ncbi:MAG TPA: hypothetical protein VGR74_10540 [Actinomycetota bacterium]|nr:hypothetical protein [Actinomycetota bacterium]
MNEPSTADAACIVRLWLERGDPVLRGRIESTLDGGTASTARGIDDLAIAFAAELHRIEKTLANDA